MALIDAKPGLAIGVGGKTRIDVSVVDRGITRICNRRPIAASILNSSIHLEGPTGFEALA